MIVLAYAVSLQGAEYRWFLLFLLVILTGVHRRDRMGLVAFSLAGSSRDLPCKSVGMNALMNLRRLFIVPPLTRCDPLRVAVPAAAGGPCGWVPKRGRRRHQSVRTTGGR